MGTGSFPGVKRPGRGVNHPPPSGAEVKKRVELYVCSPYGSSWPVLRWTLPLLHLQSVFEGSAHENSGIVLWGRLQSLSPNPCRFSGLILGCIIHTIKTAALNKVGISLLNYSMNPLVLKFWCKDFLKDEIVQGRVPVVGNLAKATIPIFYRYIYQFNDAHNIGYMELQKTAILGTAHIFREVLM